MADITFPSIEGVDYGTTLDVEDTSITSTMEDGMVQGRRKFTKSRKTWKLKWTTLSFNNYLTLMDFLQNTVFFTALPFSWLSPIDGKTYTVRYAGKEEFTTLEGERVAGSITLTEV